MRRTTTTAAVTVFLAVAAAACGSDDGASTYQVTRDGEEVTVRETRPPATTVPDNTIVLPTFPTTDAPATSSTSTSPPTSIVPADEDVTITGTWIDGASEDGYRWGFTYEYAGADPTEFVPVAVRFMDEDGATVTTSEVAIPLLLPGPGAFGEFDYLDGAIAAIEVTVGVGDPTEFALDGELTVDQVAYDDSLAAVTGRVTSTYPTDLDDVRMTAVWRDDAGDVAAVAAQTTRLVQADGVSWFVIELLDDVTGPPSEVYALPYPVPYRYTPADPALTITDQWYLADGSGGYAWGVILTDDAEKVWDGVLVTARFYDSDGDLVAADDAYQSDGRTGATALTARVWSAPVEVASMEVEVLDGGTAGEPDSGTVTIADLALVDDDGLPTVTATATSTYAEPLEYVQVVFVWRDDAGEIVFATSAYADEIPANGTAEVEVPLYSPGAPATPPTEAYWSR